MKCQKTINLLDIATNETSKYGTNAWGEPGDNDAGKKADELAKK